MKKILSKQRIFRSLLICLCIFTWGIQIPGQSGSRETLFCYTRDAFGNKALVKENGAVFVEDIFIMEIPKEEFAYSEDTKITIILEDKEGNQKIKTMRLYEKKP